MNTQKIRFLLFVFIVFFGISSFFVFKLSKATENNSIWRNAIMNLRLLNKEIDAYFKNSLVNTNYDEINTVFADFKTNLDQLKNVDSFSVLSDIYGNDNDIAIIQNIYLKKLQLLDRLNYVNSSIVSFLFEYEYILNKNYEFKKFEPLFLKLKYVDFSNTRSIKGIEQDIINLKNDIDINTKYYKDILQKTQMILFSLKLLRELHQQNVILNLSSYLDNILIAYDHQYARILDLLQIFMLLSFSIFCFVLFFIALQSLSYFKILKELAMVKTAVDNSFGSVIFTDISNKITYVNKEFERSSGYKSGEIIGKNPSILKSSLHGDEFYENIRSSIMNLEEWDANELVSKTKSGRYIHEKVKFLPFVYENKLSGFIGLKMDRTKETRMVYELELKNEQLKVQSGIDKLTGFGNYFAMTERLEEKKDGIVVSINIKNFDNLRFFYQTNTTEAMLKAFANTLKLCVDTSEIKGELFRFQDDEFFMWYIGDDIDKDIGYIQDYFSFNTIEVKVGNKIENLPGVKIVIGVSSLNDTEQTNRLMQAILANQEARKEAVDIYAYKENDAIELRYYKNQTITQLIEYALENDTVVVECQGIYDVSKIGEKATYYEILVRIVDENGKIRYPGEFLEIAMQAQLYTQITKKVISRAFLLVEKYPDYMFSVNLSGIDIIDSSVREFLEEKLELCSDPSRICFEILESEEVSDYGIVNSFIKHIKGHGSQISIDDFGSGYSNYYRILELDIDNIKIDGSIIKKLPYDKNSQYLVETILNFASKQGYNVVAEYVSSEEILEQIKKFKIPLAQGFLLGKPQPSDSL
ncbi:EAL domain-containing protein [Campylobacter pinnipediorum]|uniref:EAL domain-containing protein n=1 Tax=Campylobacter pinnipediorum TaxID=1965231 RepID=UPI00084D349C|nr:EAL domain-containing protein [Campylobacter pinnipediorum]